MSYKYKSLNDIKSEFAKISQYIQEEGLPDDLGPFVFAVTGLGNVSKAALEFLELLPHEKINVSQLEEIVNENSNCFFSLDLYLNFHFKSTTIGFIYSSSM